MFVAGENINKMRERPVGDVSIPSANFACFLLAIVHDVEGCGVFVNLLLESFNNRPHRLTTNAECSGLGAREGDRVPDGALLCVFRVLLAEQRRDVLIRLDGFLLGNVGAIFLNSSSVAIPKFVEGNERLVQFLFGHLRSVQ